MRYFLGLALLSATVLTVSAQSWVHSQDGKPSLHERVANILSQEEDPTVYENPLFDPIVEDLITVSFPNSALVHETKCVSCCM